MAYHYRITWLDGVPHVQCCPVEVVLECTTCCDRRRPGNYARDGKILRPATATDMAAMYAGRIAHDPATDPSSLMWAKHVAAGGD